MMDFSQEEIAKLTELTLKKICVLSRGPQTPLRVSRLTMYRRILIKLSGDKTPREKFRSKWQGSRQ